MGESMTKYLFFDDREGKNKIQKIKIFEISRFCTDLFINKIWTTELKKNIGQLYNEIAKKAFFNLM